MDRVRVTKNQSDSYEIVMVMVKCKQNLLKDGKRWMTDAHFVHLESVVKSLY